METIIVVSQLLQAVAAVAIGIALFRELFVRKSTGTIWVIAAIALGIIGSIFSLTIDVATSDEVLRFAGSAATMSYSLFPGALYGFTYAFSGRRPRVDRVVIAATAVFVVGAVIFPAHPRSVRHGGDYWWNSSTMNHSFYVALGVYSTIVIGVVAYRLWGVGGTLRSRVIQRRMQVMAAGVLGLAAAAAIPDIFPSGMSEVIGNVFGAIGSVLIALTIWVPRFIRLLWQDDAWESSAPVIRTLIDSDTAEHVADEALPYIADLVGAQSVHILDGQGVVRASYQIPDPRGWIVPTVHYEIPLTEGMMALELSPYAPLFGGGYITIAAVLGSLVERAMDMGEQRDRARLEAEQIREAERVKDTLLASVGHDLRTPLTVVLGFAMTMQQRADLSENDRSMMMAEVVQAATRLERVLDDVIGLISIGHSPIVIDRQATDIRGLVAAVLDRAMLGERSVQLSGEPVIADVCPVRMERVFDNLVSNIMRHTPPDALVAASVAETNGGVEVVFDDNGAGVPEDQWDQLFEPFVRGRDRPMGVPGSGLGLSIVASFVRLHNGRVWVDRSPQGGARFGVWVPLRFEV